MRFFYFSCRFGVLVSTRVGMRSTTSAPMPPSSSSAPCTHGRSENAQIEKEMVSAIVPTARYLVPRVRLRCRSQLRSIGPSRRCCSIQRCTRGDALAKQAAASNTKGVVGRPGRKMPITPSSRASPPARPYSSLATRDRDCCGLPVCSGLMQASGGDVWRSHRQQVCKERRDSDGACDLLY